MSEISEDKLSKALSNLEQLSKGQTVSTTPATMVSQSGPTQVFHTPANSDPGSWAGSKEEDVPGNGPGVDKIGAGDGTDLRMMKSILAKLAKGMDLSDDEKKVVAKAMKDDDGDKKPSPFGKKDDDKDEDDKKDKKPMPFGKSLLETASESPAMSAGFEISSFLKDQTAVLSKSLSDMEARLRSHVDAQIASLRSDYTEVTKSFGDMATVVGATAHKITALENSPARGPKSAVAANNALNKSLAAPAGEPLSKAMVESALHDLMIAKEITPFDAINFNTNSVLPRELERKVLKHLGR